MLRVGRLLSYYLLLSTINYLSPSTLSSMKNIFHLLMITMRTLILNDRRQTFHLSIKLKNQMKPIAFKYSQNTPKRYDTADINFCSLCLHSKQAKLISAVRDVSILLFTDCICIKHVMSESQASLIQNSIAFIYFRI